MHGGYFQSYHDRKIKRLYPNADGFFKPKKWRLFINTATACRMLATPKEFKAPCCDCEYVGGDGTAIGIPRGCVGGIRPAWKPEEQLILPEKRSRLARCGLPSNTRDSDERKDIQDARNLILNMTSPTVSADEMSDLRLRMVQYRLVMGESIFNELNHWSVLEKSEPEYYPLRDLLCAMGKQDSISGIIHVSMMDSVKDLLECIENGINTIIGETWEVLLRNVALYGMGPEIVRCLRAQHKDRRFRWSFKALLLDLCKWYF